MTFFGLSSWFRSRFLTAHSSFPDDELSLLYGRCVISLWRCSSSSLEPSRFNSKYCQSQSTAAVHASYASSVAIFTTDVYLQYYWVVLSDSSLSDSICNCQIAIVHFIYIQRAHRPLARRAYTIHTVPSSLSVQYIMCRLLFCQVSFPSLLVL
jgi:hypothetical protein